LRSRQAYRKARLQRLLVFDVCRRSGVDDHSDEVDAVLLAKPEQLGNAPSQRSCLIPSPQFNIELEYGGEIVVEREPAS
jgi:hypothetical protein